MAVFAFFSSVLSIIENTLSVKYRININGEFRGGSSYYIDKGLKKKKIGILIAFFLVLTNSLIFQPLQVNTLSEAVNIGLNIPYYLIFLCLSLFAIFFIFSGTKKIVSFSEKIVPFMSVGFMLISIYSIIINIDKLPNVLMLVIKEAFNFKSFYAGGLFVGIKRSLFSHEAGLGTMPTISAMSEVDKPVDQGFIQCFGVFFDTIIMCTLTGIMIIITGVDISIYNGYDLIVAIFGIIINNNVIGKYIAVLFMFMFALATIVSQYYLGESNLIYLTNQKENNTAKFIYRMLYIIGIFIGVFLPLQKIWSIIDYGMCIIGLINIYAIIKLQHKFKEELNK